MLEIIGKCDNTYIYLDELRWADLSGEERYSYIPKKNETQTGEDTLGIFYYGIPKENGFIL